MRLKESLVVVREMPSRRGARRGGRGGRGRGAECVQPEVQPVAQATDPAARVTHADLATMEQRFRDLIMQMREQQQPALASSCSSFSCTPGRVGSVVGRGQAFERFQKVQPHDIRWVFRGPHQGSDVVIFFGDHILVYEVP
ncbi:gag protease polyprotein [Cucumis melo var. makuwa]|uniref:Gag protease polyprotein n=1 Tax=Cucumis melo var. makuwa TaxID=1194695 RepID=A0A5D3BYL5_CUCMM|nr:gag protease polyprotein [Cucumis melo var. makuwa]